MLNKMFTIKKLSSKLPMNIRRMGSNTPVKEWGISESLIMGVVYGASNIFMWSVVMSQTTNYIDYQRKTVADHIKYQRNIDALKE